MMTIEELVDLIRVQARLRSEENDEAGVLLHYAHLIQRDVDRLHHPEPFSGLDACETL